MRRRFIARVFLLDLASLAVGTVMASLVVFDRILPWSDPIVGTRTIPMIGLMVAGMVLGSWISVRTWGNGVPRPSYGRAFTIAVSTVAVTALSLVFARHLYYSRLFIAISITVGFVLGLLHRAVARVRPWSEPMVLVTSEKGLVDDLYSSAPHAEVLRVVDPASEPPDVHSAEVSLVLDLRALLSEGMARFVASCSLAGYRVRSLVNVYEEHTGKLPIVHLATGWELSTPVERAGAYHLFKRMVDVTVVLILSPALVATNAIAWSITWITVGRPILHREPKVGRHGRRFCSYRFRPLDSSTAPGRLSWRDAPKAWNVLRGDLSLVGPAPDDPQTDAERRAAIPFYGERLLIRPGVMGWAQVWRMRSNGEFDPVEMLAYDLYYVKHMSPWLDLQIVAQTAAGPFTRRDPQMPDADVPDTAELATRLSRETTTRLPSVAVVMPTFNEEDMLETCLETLTNQTYVGDLRIVVADGGSTDRTLELLERWQSRDQRLVVVDNPARIQSHGLNLAALATDAEILVRADAHTLYEPDYVESSVEALLETAAVAVGGPMRPQSDTTFGAAVAKAMRSPLGVGPGASHHANQRLYVDTVYLGAFRREEFIAVGGFRTLPSHVAEDADLYWRLRRRGERIVLDPAIKSTYRPRESVSALWRQFWRYGLGKADLLFVNGRWPSWRPAATAALVGGIGIGALLSAFGFWQPLALLLVAWVAALSSVGAGSPNPAQFLRAVLAAGIMHVAYGLGLIKGLVRNPESVRRAVDPGIVEPAAMSKA